MNDYSTLKQEIEKLESEIKTITFPQYKCNLSEYLKRPEVKIVDYLDKLSKEYDKPVMLFVDEYDVPLQNAYVQGFYEEAIEFSRVELGKISDKFAIISDNFRNIKDDLRNIGVEKVDGVLFDLDLSPTSSTLTLLR